jgi:hypothetical protein
VPTVIEVPLTSDGLAQSGDPKVVKPGTPVTLDNLRFDRFGRLEGRRGFSDAGLTKRCSRIITLPAATLALLQDEPATASQQYATTEPLLTQRGDDWQTSYWTGTTSRTQGRVPLVSNVERHVLWPDYDVLHHACAIGEVDGVRALMSVICTTDGTMGFRTFLLPDFELATEAMTVAGAKGSCRVFWDSSNEHWVIVSVPFNESGFGESTDKFCTNDLTGLLPQSFGTTYQISDALGGPFDAVWPDGSDYLYVMHVIRDGAGSDGIRYASIHHSALDDYWESGTLTADDCTAAAVSADGKSLAWVKQSDSKAYYTHVSDISVGPDFSPVEIASARRVAFGGYKDSTHVSLYTDLLDTTQHFRRTRIWSHKITLADGTAESVSEVVGAELATAPIVLDDGGTEWHDVLMVTCGIAPETPDPWAYQGHHVLASVRYHSGIRRMSPVANLWPDEYGRWLTSSPETTESISRGVPDGAEHFVPVTETTAFSDTAKGVVYSYRINGPDLGHYCQEQRDDVATVGGGIVFSLDSAAYSPEQVPIQYPVIYATDGGASARSGTFFYQACFAYTDRFGRRARGPMSLQVSHAASSIDTHLYIAVSHLTRTVTNLVLYGLDVELYRSDDGRLYHLMGTYPTGSYEVLSISDDDVLEAFDDQPAPYTETGEPARFCPPWSDSLCLHSGRLFSACGKRVYYSHWLQEGEIPQWTAVGYFDCSETVRAMASFGGNLLLLSDSSVWYVSGDGPDRLLNGAFDAPRLLSAGVGASRKYGGARSLVVAAGSVWFRSERTIERLSGGEPELVGDQIRDVLATYPRVRDVCHVPEQYAIYWSLGPEDITADEQDRAIVRYDYLHNSWSTVSGWFPVVAGPLGHLGDKLLVGIDAYVDDATPGIWEETDEYFDVFATEEQYAFSGTIEFAPFRPFGNGGRGWIRKLTLLGEHRDKATVALQVKDDALRFSIPDYYSQGFTSDDTPGKIMEREHSLRHPFGGMVQIKLTLQASTDEDGELPFLSALSLEVDQLPGAKKLRYSRKF